MNSEIVEWISNLSLLHWIILVAVPGVVGGLVGGGIFCTMVFKKRTQIIPESEKTNYDHYTN